MALLDLGILELMLRMMSVVVVFVLLGLDRH
jgi:hypothetical protein